MSQRLKLNFFFFINKEPENCTNLDLSFVHVRGEVGDDDFLGENVAWHRGRGSRCTPCGGLSSGLAGDSNLGSSSATGTSGIPLLLGNDLRKGSGIAGAERRLLTSSRDLSRTIEVAIRMFFRVIWSLRAGTSEGSAKGFVVVGRDGRFFVRDVWCLVSLDVVREDPKTRKICIENSPTIHGNTQSLSEWRMAFGGPHHQNFPKTLPRPPYSDAELPNNIPTPSCSATLTGRIGALSQTWGHGSGNGGLVNRGLDRSRSYIDGCRGSSDSSSHCGETKFARAARSRASTCS